MARRTRKPDLAMLRVQAVGIVLQHEVNTGYMSATLVKTLLGRMDEAYNILLAQQKDATSNG
jgi:hypothetical protein